MNNVKERGGYFKKPEMPGNDFKAITILSYTHTHTHDMEEFTWKDKALRIKNVVLLFLILFPRRFEELCFFILCREF